MKKVRRSTQLLIYLLLISSFFGCNKQNEFDLEELASQPAAYVGSEECKFCHLEHYDSWRNTLHSFTMADVSRNQDTLIAVPVPELVRADLALLSDQLKKPVDEIYIPDIKNIRYTIGTQWKQGFVVEKENVLYVAPIQYDARAEKWINYHEEDWEKRPYIKNCGGCHATGVDFDTGTFVEPRVGCESCHGPGSQHVAFPETAVFKKRKTIVNPSHLPVSFRTQICGSCHDRGMSTQKVDVPWPVGYVPGRSLGLFFKSEVYDETNLIEEYASHFSEGHHQQYLEWKLSVHSKEGVTCTSCHFVHQLGLSPTKFQTKGAGSQQCLECHVMTNKNAAHSIHSFGSCVGCHMPRIVKSSESGDTHSHVFVTLEPKDTIKNPDIPNSCQSCHKHKNTDARILQQWLEAVTDNSLVRVHQSSRKRQ